MGCVSSKLVAKEIKQEKLDGNGDYSHHVHVVSLTSSTYGVLKLDKEKEEVEVKKQRSTKECVVVEELKKSSSSSNPSPSPSPSPSGEEEEPSEIINAWELMEGLEEEASMSMVVQSKRSPRSRIFDAKSPLKFLNQMGSPRKVKKVGGGKENNNGGRISRSLENSPRTVLKECNLKKPSPRLWASIKGSPNKRCDDGRGRRRSLEEDMKNCRSHDDAILESYKDKCPPGGENAVVFYTTTLRGIRKTFEECNVARSIIESQNVQMFERDISMHSAYKDELRALMSSSSSKEVRVPQVFVKGRLIGGADEMVKLDEGGKLGILFRGIPKAKAGGCAACGGIRFVMCMDCNGSSKLVGHDGKKTVKCNKCNENGLIHCPICSSFSSSSSLTM